MKLHNTLTRETEEFRPLKEGQVTLYSCGPTVYHYYHIGNLRNAVFNDTLRRTLELKYAEVKHVMNITDVGHLVSDDDEGEDKLEKGAAREGKTAWDVAAFYTEAFKSDMTAMNVLAPSINPGRSKNVSGGDSYARATDFIPEQIEMVRLLLEKGFAYITEQAIYFDVTKLPNYGELTGQKLADKENAARSDVVTDKEKKSPYDFAVWFFTVGRFADHSMHWATPWGDGFPGWHLECSAIIHSALGDPIDIHTGGIDHIGTHHPNEMAQTEAAYGHPLAKVWLHNDFNLVDGQKMSKSKGNAYTLKEVTDRDFLPMALRLLYLQAHYRTELNFSWESLQAASNALGNLYAWADRAHQEAPNGLLRESLEARLFDDLDTPGALAELFGFTVHSVPSENDLVWLDKLLGLGFADRPDITPAQKQLIDEREQARAAKEWARSDAIRDQLLKDGIELDDTPTGSRWRRVQKQGSK